MNLFWVPFYSLLFREVKRFMRVASQTLLTPIVSSTLYLMIFGVSLGSQIKVQGDVPYLLFLIPGLVMMGCLNNAFQNSSSSIISSKFAGDLEDLKASPLTPNQILMALGLAAVVRGLVVALITFVVGEVSYYFTYGEWFGVVHPFWLFLFLVLGGLSFANIGIVAAFWAKSFDQISAIGGFLLVPLIYLGGVFFSVDLLPPFWKQVALMNPLLYVINGVRFGILGHSDVEVEISLIVASVGLLISLVAAAWLLRRGSYQRW